MSPNRDSTAKTTSHPPSYGNGHKVRSKDPTPHKLFVSLDSPDHSSDDGNGNLDVRPRNSNVMESVAVVGSTVPSGQMRGKSKQRANSTHMLHSDLSSGSDEHLHR